MRVTSSDLELPMLSGVEQPRFVRRLQGRIGEYSDRSRHRHSFTPRPYRLPTTSRYHALMRLARERPSRSALPRPRTDRSALSLLPTGNWWSCRLAASLEALDDQPHLRTN